MAEIREGEHVTIQKIVFRDDSVTEWSLVGANGGVEVFPIPFSQIENSARRRWLVKTYVGKCFPKKSPTFKFECSTPTTEHGVVIGPYASMCLLRRNMVNQRGFIIKDVEDLANSMNHWHPSHQGIALLKDGTMYDGQNRGLANIKTNLEIPVTLTRGMPLEAVLACDRQYRRTLLDNAAMGGLVENAEVLGLHRTMVEAAGRNIHYEATNSNICSTEDLAHVFQIYKPSLDALSPFYRSKFTNSKIMREGHIVAAFALIHRVYPEEAMVFIHAIAAASYPNDSQDYPPRRVVQFLQDRKGKKKIHSKKEFFTPGSKIIYKILWGFKFFLSEKLCCSLNAEDSALLHLYPQRRDILRENYIQHRVAPAVH